MGQKKSMQQLLADWRNAQNRMTDLYNSAPRMMGVECVKIVVENFAKQGYDDGQTFTPWQKRAEVTNKAYDYNRTGKFRTKTGKKSKAKNPYKGSTFQSSNPILEQTRTLKRSIRYFLRKGGVTIGVDPQLVIYAQKMNEGGRGKWGRYAKTFTPARQFQPKPNEPPNRKMINAITDKMRWETEKRLADFKNYKKKR